MNKERPIAQLETHLERLIEGAFTHLFGRRTAGAGDIAMQLARAMENNALPPPKNEVRPIAPDVYIIAMHEDMLKPLLAKQPNLSEALAKHIVELATQSGYKMNHHPQIYFRAEPQITLNIQAQHRDTHSTQTAAMSPVHLPSPFTPPPNAHLLFNDARIKLDKPLVNLGRERDNHVMLNDPFASRYHAQLRLRDGVYLLFDTNSRSGTFVNEIQIKEHRMQPGDVIRIGKAQLIYLDDSGTPTSSMEPVSEA
jgi:hypothetical protein